MTFIPPGTPARKRDPFIGIENLDSPTSPKERKIDSPQSRSSLSSLVEQTPQKRNTFVSPLGLRKKETPFVAINRQLSEGSLKVGEELEYPTVCCSQGSYFNVYKVTDNNQIVLKAFHGKNSGFCQEDLDQCLGNMSHNYQRIQDAGLPIAKIRNLEQLANDRYIVQEYVPNEIDLTSQEQLSQITPFFNASVKQQIVMDLHPDNFRADDKGNLRLVDFVEKVKPEKYTEEKVNMFNNRAIAGWFEKLLPLAKSKEETINRLHQLTGYSTEDISEIHVIKSTGTKIEVIGTHNRF